MPEIFWRLSTDENVGLYEYQRHVFGARSSPTCANYALQRVGEDNKDTHPVAANAIKRNFYMDDFIKSVNTVQEGINCFNQLQPLLSSYGFDLKKWISNSNEVNSIIPEDLRSSADVKTIEQEPTVNQPSILGLQWCVSDDSLQVCCGTNKVIEGQIMQRKICLLSPQYLIRWVCLRLSLWKCVDC